MTLAAQEETLLGVIRDIYLVSTRCGIKTYLWGGLVRDVYAGRFLRTHGDVDGFTCHLWARKDDLAEEYERLGYAVTFLEEVQFLRIERGGIHAVLNCLDSEGETALWRHIGEQGTVGFPLDWLPTTPLPFYDTFAYVAGVEFEYCIKTNPRLLSPTWQGREKDRETLGWLEEELQRQEKPAEEILEKIWSYNPYWIRKGYPEYRFRIYASTPHHKPD